MKIGVLADCFGRSLYENLDIAASLGVDGVQLYAVEGDLAPENMKDNDRRRLTTYIKDADLEISAVCGDLGGFAYPGKNPERIARTKLIVDLAVDLGCPIITTHIGVIPEDFTHERYRTLRDACEEIGAYAEKRNAVLAIETGPECSLTLKRFIESLDTDGIRMNFDPANLIMTLNENAVEAINNLGALTVHTHAKDGRCYKLCDPDVMYLMPGAFDSDYDESQYCAELPLGEGDVDFPSYLRALKATGFDGYLTIERETGEDPAADIAKAVGFLRSQWPVLK